MVCNKLMYTDTQTLKQLSFSNRKHLMVASTSWPRLIFSKTALSVCCTPICVLYDRKHRDKT